MGYAQGSLTKSPELFPDFAGIVQQLETQFKQLREQPLFRKAPAAHSSSHNDEIRTTYTSLTPGGVKERVADATRSAWGKLVIGPTDKGISIWRRAVRSLHEAFIPTRKSCFWIFFSVNDTFSPMAGARF